MVTMNRKPKEFECVHCGELISDPNGQCEECKRELETGVFSCKPAKLPGIGNPNTVVELEDIRYHGDRFESAEW